MWYFKVTGLLDEAIQFHPFAHRYRTQVFYDSPKYVDWMRSSDWKTFTWYQFCRDPVKRAVSSYRHAISLGYADERISQALGMQMSHRRGYSLEQFLQYLETQDLAGKCDPHVRLQWHPVSDVIQPKIINIDETDMFAQMNAIERNHGLPITDFASSEVFQKDDRRRAHFAGGKHYSSTDVLRRKEAKGAWPVHASVLEPSTVERIKRIYARDIRFIYGEQR
jgi:hypothetical protein